MEEKLLKEKALEKLNNWTAKLEELKNQINSESEETFDGFEAQKAKLNKWIEKVKIKLNDAEGIGKEKAEKVHEMLGELKEKALQAKAETEVTMDEQHKNLSEKLDKLKDYLADAYKDSKDSAKDLAEDALDDLDDFHAKFDAYKIKALHMTKDAEDIWEDKRKEINKKLNEFSAKIKDRQGEASEKWEDISKELSEAWKHVRKAFKS